MYVVSTMLHNIRSNFTCAKHMIHMCIPSRGGGIGWWHRGSGIGAAA